MEAGETRNWFARIDPVLLLALLAALLFSLHGMHWGRVEDWNPDEMAMRRLSLTLEPHEFLKPPFYIFVNHLVVLWPLEIFEAVGRGITGRVFHLDGLKLLASRLLVAAFYLGTIVLGYKTARDFYGRTAARVIALLLATSAGFFAYVHFLTADIPVIAAMMLAFWLASRIVFAPTMRNYIAAGLCVGLATATKYNGLAVGIAIPVAHVLSRPWSWRAFLPDRRLIIGLLMVPIGFLLGNPHALFHWGNFSRDFVYNYEVTPRYGGEEGIGFGRFGYRIFDILGVPGGILVTLLVVISILLLVRRKTDAPATKGFLLCASVFGLYALKMGSFPRVPMRFVLPAVPFLILMIGPACRLRALRSRASHAVLALILLYNSVNAFYVGKRFRDDPRMAAQLWVQEKCPRPRAH